MLISEFPVRFNSFRHQALAPVFLGQYISDFPAGHMGKLRKICFIIFLNSQRTNRNPADLLPSMGARSIAVFLMLQY